MRRSAVYILLGVLLAGCMAEERERADPSRRAMDALIAFARAPSDATWAAVPLAESVDLGLADVFYLRLSARQLRNPRAWTLSVDGFRGRAGSASAVALIAAEDGRLRVTRGPHRHCAAPPEPEPPQVTPLERVVVQPRDADGCLDWWTVDAFVDDEGKIRAVTLDLWEP